jgi:hypothetical protein
VADRILNRVFIRAAAFKRGFRLALTLNGGTQRLFVTNMSAGSHQVTAFFTGTDHNGRAIKRAKSVLVDKGDTSAFLEIQVGDSPAKQEPVFEFKQW